ncbi:MAG: GNAT family N-acetyltransferase [Pirellulaceae bacterium]|nr:GNAT family N-acetyltransferase [Pirellulaceae bacterium]
MDRSAANDAPKELLGGFRLKLTRLIYSVLRRVGIADYGLVFSCPLQRLQDSQGPFDRRLRYEELSPAECESIRECNPEVHLRLFETLVPERFRCCVLRMENTIVAYAWIGLGDIPAEHNLNGHEWTGLPLVVDDSTAYLFAAFVGTQLRGKRLYQNLLCWIARSLEREGIERIVLTADLKNEPAIKSVRRIGFELIGDTKFFCGFGLRHASYRVDESFAPCELGKYVGDR